MRRAPSGPDTLTINWNFLVGLAAATPVDTPQDMFPASQNQYSIDPTVSGRLAGLNAYYSYTSGAGPGAGRTVRVTLLKNEVEWAHVDISEDETQAWILDALPFVEGDIIRAVSSVVGPNALTATGIMSVTIALELDKQS
jgi:hypothetical protein